MPDTSRYPSDTLRWVAAEVRYPTLEAIATGTPAEFRESIREHFPIQEEETEVLLGPGASAPQQSTRFRFLARDRLMSVTVGRNAVSLETTSYSGWESFRALFDHVLLALRDTVRPDGIARVGLRYIDEIRIPTSVPPIIEWKEWVDERLVAPFPLDDAALQKNVSIVLQFSEAPGYRTAFRAASLAAGRTVQSQGPLRMPFETPEGPYFLLDTDASWTEPQRQLPEFAIDQIHDISDKLHAQCRRLFERSITQRLRDEILSQPRAEGSGQ